jgi:hypothetical protein
VLRGRRRLDNKVTSSQLGHLLLLLLLKVVQLLLLPHLLLLEQGLLLLHHLLSFDHSEVREETIEVELILLGVNPELPVDEPEKLGLQKIHLLKVHAADVCDEMVPIEYIIVELGGE